MKAIIIGTSLSGKTTLIRYLRTVVDAPISEMDEELTVRNNGEFPSDYEYKSKVLTPQIVKDVLSKESVLFFTNTDYFSHDDLRNARENNFTIIQLDLGLDSLKVRNKLRVENDGYADLSQWLEGMNQYQENIKKLGLVDATVNMDQPVEVIATELLDVLNK